MNRSAALLLALLPLLPTAARAAQDGCYAQAEQLLHSTTTSRAHARTWSPLELLLRASSVTPGRPVAGWNEQDPQGGAGGETAIAERWVAAVRYARGVHADHAKACGLAYTRPPACVDAAPELWISGPASQLYTKSWSAMELLANASGPAEVARAWLERDARAGGNTEAHREAASRWALGLFHAFASGCRPEDLVPQADVNVRLFAPPTPAEMQAHHPRLRRFDRAPLPYVLGAPVELPATDRWQFTSTLVETAGRAGFAPTLSFSGRLPDAPAWNGTMAVSLLFVLPGDRAGQPGPPFAGGDFLVGATTDNRDAWQMALRNPDRAYRRKLEDLQRSAFLQAVTRYRALARQEPDRLALQTALGAGREDFRQSVERHVLDAYVQPSLASHWSVDVYSRLRVTADATATPEIPDLFSANAGGRVAWHSLRRSDALNLSVHLLVNAGISAYPTSEVLHYAEAAYLPDSRAVPLFEGALGITLEMPETSNLPGSTLAFSALLRRAVGRPDNSLGVSGSFMVPLSSNLGIGSTLTLRWDQVTRRWIGTSGLTLAGALSR